MNDIRCGFTGTRQGMTTQQKATVRGMLKGMQPNVINHGGCVGADEDFHNIYKELYIMDRLITKINIYPSNMYGTQMPRDTDEEWVEYFPPDEPLKRNHTIIDNSWILIACPKEDQEVLRSGTWATIRYAKPSIPVFIVFPDGGTIYSLPDKKNIKV